MVDDQGEATDEQTEVPRASSIHPRTKDMHRHAPRCAHATQDAEEAKEEDEGNALRGLAIFRTRLYHACYTYIRAPTSKCKAPDLFFSLPDETQEA